MLKNHWINAVKSLNLDPKLADKAHAQLLRAYQASWRKYHNLVHIDALLKLAERYQAQLQHVHEVVMAIWFHDAIYQPLRPDSEARSARLAKKFLTQAGASQETTERIIFMIQHTALHTEELGAEHQDCAYFLDFDLSILGQEPELYQTYQQHIRQEFRFIPDVIFRAKRIKIIKNMLQMPFIYRMPETRELYEKQARKNLLSELKYWEYIEV